MRNVRNALSDSDAETQFGAVLNLKEFTDKVYACERENLTAELAKAWQRIDALLDKYGLACEDRDQAKQQCKKLQTLLAAVQESEARRQFISKSGGAKNPNLSLVCSRKDLVAYRGKWVAIYGGQILAHDEQLEKLAAGSYGGRQPLFHWVPQDDY